MSKYTIFQDGHFILKNSINRLGSYEKDWLLKFDEMIEISKEEKVQAILDNGDILHSANPSYRVLDEIADRVEKYQIPIYSLFGNHATLYHSVNHSQYTGLSHLMKRSKYFKYLPDYKFDDIEVIAIDYEHDIEERLKNENLFNFKTDKYRVGFVHAFVSQKPFPFASHVECKDLKNSGNCVIWVGHYHCQYSEKIGNTVFENLGCFGRRSISEANIQPSIAILDTEKRDYEIIKLKSAKDGSEVFDLSKKEEEKYVSKDLKKFLESLNDFQFKSMDLRDKIKEFAKSQDTDKNVLNDIIERLNKK